MKKSWTKIQLCALAAAALVAVGAGAAPIVVTKGSNSGYLYFPGGASAGPDLNNPNGGSVDKLQTAPTACMTASGVVPMPDGFTTGTIQAIVVAGGQGGWSHHAAGRPGTRSSLTHPGGTVEAAGTLALGGNGFFGAAAAVGGGAGGYGGQGGNGSDLTSSIGGKAGDGGSNAPYGAAQGGRGGVGMGNAANGNDGQGAVQPVSPAYIPCPNTPARGYGGGGNGYLGGDGGGAGAVVTAIFRYTGGTLTAIVGAGGSPAETAEPGMPGVVALRFIAD